MRRAGVLIWIPVLALMAASCGEPGEDPDVAAGGDSDHAAEATSEAVALGSALAQIRGHHLVVVDLYEDGDREGALVHAGHPIDEILTSASTELEEHGGSAAELEASLEEVQGLVQREAPPQQVRVAVEDATTATEDATAAFAGEEAESAGYRGSVIADLLATAAHEYEEAVAGGAGVKLLVEYQDAFGFLQEGHRLYEQVQAEVTAASQEEADEIAEAFETLDAALPSVRPPQNLATALDVESAAELIGHELEETVGAQLLEEQDPEEIAEEIEKLLGEVVTTYRAGDSDEAAELAAEAYLENYEVIEAEVIEKAPDINEELEPLLGAELRKRIQEGAPVGEIEDMVDRVEELLGRALEALEEE